LEDDGGCAIQESKVVKTVNALLALACLTPPAAIGGGQTTVGKLVFMETQSQDDSRRKQVFGASPVG
jgi:hypothetical protein